MGSIYHGTSLLWRPRAEQAQLRTFSADGRVVLELASIAFSWSVSLVALNACPATTSGAPATLVADPIVALSVSEAGIAVATAASVQVLDVRGRLVRTLHLATGDGDRRKGRRPLAIDGALSAPGLPADVDWARASDLETIADSDDPRLADEPRREEPRARVTSRQAREVRVAPRERRGVALATGAAGAWVGRTDGLWRVDLTDGELVRVNAPGEAPIEQVATSSDGGHVAYTQGRRLRSSHDRGRTFTEGETLPFTPTELAATDVGTILAIDHSAGVVLLRAPAGDSEQAARFEEITAMATCGRKVFMVRGDRLATLGAHPPHSPALVDTGRVVPAGVVQLACTDEHRLVAVTTQGIEESANEGETWNPVAGEYPGAVGGVGLTKAGIWVGGSAGLWIFERPGAHAAAPDADANSCACASLSEIPRGLRARRGAVVPSRWLGSLLPRLDLVLAVAAAGARRETLGLLSLTFVLDPRPVIWDGRLTQALLAPPSACSTASLVTGSDVLSAEERSALVRIVEERP